MGANEYTVNIPLQPNDELYTKILGRNVILQWGDFYDDHSHASALMYNVYLDTAQGTGDVISPISDISTGARYIIHEGNSADALSCEVKNLLPGNYYWSVQAIDQAYCGGEFAAEASFEIVEVGYMENENLKVSVSPNPVEYNAEFRCENMDNITIYSAEGELMFSGVSDGNPMSVDIHNWSPGVYFYQVTVINSMLTGKLLKR